MVELGEPNVDALDGGANDAAKAAARPAASKSAASTSTATRQARLAQLHELEGELKEERRQTQKLRAVLEQECTARGAGARAAGCVV